MKGRDVGVLCPSAGSCSLFFKFSKHNKSLPALSLSAPSTPPLVQRVIHKPLASQYHQLSYEHSPNTFIALYITFKLSVHWKYVSCKEQCNHSCLSLTNSLPSYHLLKTCLVPCALNASLISSFLNVWIWVLHSASVLCRSVWVTV